MSLVPHVTKTQSPQNFLNSETACINVQPFSLNSSLVILVSFLTFEQSFLPICGEISISNLSIIFRLSSVLTAPNSIISFTNLCSLLLYEPFHSRSNTTKLIIFMECLFHSLFLRKNTLTHTDIFGSNLYKLIICNKLKTLLKRKN